MSSASIASGRLLRKDETRNKREMSVKSLTRQPTPQFLSTGNIRRVSQAEVSQVQQTYLANNDTDRHVQRSGCRQAQCNHRPGWSQVHDRLIEGRSLKNGIKR